MKRIIVWVDIKSDDVEQVRERIKKFLRSIGLRHTIVEVCEIRELGESK